MSGITPGLSIARTFWKDVFNIDDFESFFSFEGVPDEKHWFDDMFRSRSVVNFLNQQSSRPKSDTELERWKGSFEFTLTVSNPIEAGSFQGFRIMMLLQGWK